MYHYQTAYWPQSNPYFAAFRTLTRPLGDERATCAGAARTDRQIEQDVRDELEMEPSVRAAAVDIQSRDGVVTLSGVVDGAGERWLIEAAARRIAGVRDVSEQLKVYAPDITPADDDIAHDCERVLSRLVPKAHYSIGVMVSNGWVTLSGNVAEGYERRIAESEVGSLLSVHGVNSQVRVRSSIGRPAPDSDIGIRTPKQYELKSGSYEFAADHDRVTWSGAVLSWTEYRDMLYAAWSSFRAKHVTERVRSS